MLYPAYIRRSKNGTHVATFPDFNDSFANIKKRGYLSSSFKVIVEGYLKSRHDAPSPPSRPQDWFFDRRFQGGYWVLINLNLEHAALPAVSTGYRSLL